MSGRGRGRGRGGRGQPRHDRPSPSPASSSGGRGGNHHIPPPASSQFPALSSPTPPLASSSASLSRDMQLKLTLQSPAPAQLTLPPVVQTPPPPQSVKEAVQPPPASSKAVRLPARPGFGTAGQKCIVRANHFMVQVAERDLHHYDVSITPEVISKKLHREIINKLVELYRESHLGKRQLAYDGRKSVYTAGPLPFSSKDFVIKLVDQDRGARKDREFKVSIKFAAKPDIHHLQEFMRDMSARAFYEPILVTDFVAKYFNVKDLTRPLSDQDCLKVKRALRGIKVELAHRKHVQCRRISGLSVRPTNQLTFPLDDTGEKMSVVEYFRQKYNIILEYAFLPALVAGSDAKPVYLPMEICKIVEGQRYSKKLNEKQVSALLKATCQRPDVREGSIKQMVRHNNYNNDKLVNEEFGIQVRAELASVDARVLPPPRLKYHDTGKETQVDPRVGVWNMIDKKMVNGGKVEFWTCISFSRSRINLDQFCRELISMCRSKGMVGGRNTVLMSAIERRIPFVTDRPTIIFGADVTHSQPGDDASPSIAAVVASMDWPEVTKYRGLVSAQGHKEEIIQDLYKTYQDPQRGTVHCGMIRELLIAFKTSTGQKPHRIIFYRDGVSEGQFNQVLLHEMDAIRKACVSLEEHYLPRVTFVVVQKRHHTRLFPADHNDRRSTDRSGNILPGTVVDTHICHPNEFDFYLCSHAGIQGTSRPTHYHVLYDENQFSADALQTLTNMPPAYYAHLAAFRARYYIEGDTSENESTSGGRNTRERSIEVRPLPAIKANVKDVMFYC
ncbi:hypothetical protein HYC85_030407 [Camellia sinensis]|uniref:Uncharacterized protein n=1 Tax=Camellia sinensis TaxID=4442 RepID=A0A7J7G4P9_CAMSI|nr:hypothetical protein HYC85_030407 [Camellia sinensis]